MKAGLVLCGDCGLIVADMRPRAYRNETECKCREFPADLPYHPNCRSVIQETFDKISQQIVKDYLVRIKR